MAYTNVPNPIFQIKNTNLRSSHFSNSNPVIRFRHISGKQTNSRRRRERNWILKSSNFFFALNKESSTNFEIAATLETKVEVESASNVVRKFYGGINGRDLSSVEALIADNCVYEDLIFSTPFVGRKAILDFFEKFSNCISKDLQFVIDDISAEDTTAVGVTWHLEWIGKPFPFSKGCSFYKLEVVNGQRKIIYGRDIVEPAFKPGEAALPVGKIVVTLEKFKKLRSCYQRSYLAAAEVSTVS